MFGIIGQWIVTIPIDNPWRAIVLVVVLLAAAFILHILWDLGFSLAGGLNRMIARIKASRNAPSTGPGLIMSIKSDKAG